ncbi:latrophilin Cirl-like [Tachypleus tridentatus]|uniref:latrophilin Cirl-like n=1 Tax=Tachypleus tridentatus TaxID=6853 RepID=UPI003FD15AF4
MKSLFVVVFCVVLGLAAHDKEGKYLTMFACEGTVLQLSCSHGNLIKIIRANYGRFSITVCNKDAELNWSVDCAAERSYYVMYERCAFTSSCNLNVTSATFGNPCPGTLKYLEVHYECHSEFTAQGTTVSMATDTMTTPRFPIIFPPSRPRTTQVTPLTISVSTPPNLPVTSTTTPSLHHNLFTSSPVSTTVKVSTMTSLAPSLLPKEVFVTKHLTSTTEISIPSIPRHSSASSNNLDAYCPSVISRQLLWNRTREGQSLIQKCPDGATGYARWFCGTTQVQWTPDRPDLSGCRSAWVDNLDNRIEAEESMVMIAIDLARLSRTKPMYGGDVRQSTIVMQKLVDKLTHKVRNVGERSTRYEIVQEVFQNLLESSSNLIEENRSDSWRDLPEPTKQLTISSLLESLERVTWLLAEYGLFEVVERSQSNILVSVRRVPAWSTSKIQFPSPNDKSSPTWTKVEDIMELPTPALTGQSRNGFIRILFVAYNKLETLLTSANHRSAATSVEKHRAFVVNSRVLAASLNQYGNQNLNQPVKVTFKHIQEENVTNPRCVFWDTSSSVWSQEGCWVKSTNVSHTTCLCNHLTNFALLMEVTSSSKVNEPDVFPSTAIWCGCAISIGCSAVTLTVLFLVRDLQTNLSIVRRHIGVFFLLAELMMVIQSEAYISRKTACFVVVGLLHYFLLEVFVWTLVDAVNLLLVFRDTGQSWFGWYCGSGYVAPVFIVGVAVGVNPSGYLCEDYCGLAEGYAIYSIIVPASVSALVSLGIHIVLQSHFVRNSGRAKSEHLNISVQCREWSLQSSAILVVTCLTCGSWLWYQQNHSFAAGYTFCTASCLQGFLILTCYWIRDKETREGTRKILQRLGLTQPPENKEEDVSPPEPYPVYPRRMLDSSVSYETNIRPYATSPVRPSLPPAAPEISELSHLPPNLRIHRDHPERLHTRSPIYRPGQYHPS